MCSSKWDRTSATKNSKCTRVCVDRIPPLGWFISAYLLCYCYVLLIADLEKYVIEHAGDYYKRQSRSWMDQDSCPNYLEKAERMLNQEKNRVESYLHRNTLEPLSRECYIQLLKHHQDELLKKATGVVHLLTVNSAEGMLNR